VVILLVDDAAGIRTRLRERLAREGTEIREACDEIAAYAAIASSAVDVIVLDVHVRAQAGVGVLVCLRARAHGALIVVLTNEATDVHRRESLRHGADHFFDKSREFDAAIELVLRTLAAKDRSLS
jgi:DNA-binding response OmpR family regulator